MMFFLSVLLTLGISGCLENSQRKASVEGISFLHNYVHGDTVNHKFLSVQKFITAKDFETASERVRIILNGSEASKAEMHFFQELLTELEIRAGKVLSDSISIFNDFTDLGNLTQNKRLNVTKLLNQARWFFNKAAFELSIGSSNEALVMLTDLEGDTFAGLSEVRTLIGNAFMYLPGERDSAGFHFEKAIALANTMDEAMWMQSEPQLQLAYINMINRDYLSAHINLDLAIVNTSLNSVMDSAFISECHSIKARAFRKQKLKEEEQSELKFARRYLPTQSNEAKLKAVETYFSGQAISAVDWKDDDLWKRTITDWREQYPEDFATNSARVFGYRHYQNKQYDSAVYYYRKDLIHQLKKPFQDFTIIDQAFFYLPESYSKLAKYDSALYYAFNGLTYQIDRYKLSPVDWEKLRSPLAFDQTYSFYTYNLIGKALLDNYVKGDGDIEWIRQAARTYDIMDSLLIHQVREWEEDALLRFSKQGAIAYANAINVAYELYQKFGDSRYLEKANRYFEMTKGTQLQRDVILNQSGHFENLPDSVREVERNVKVEIARLKRLVLRQRKRYSSELNRKIEEQRVILDNIRDQYPDYYESRYALDVPSLNAVSAYSSEQGVDILSYHMTPEYIYTLSWNGPKVKFDRFPVTPELVSNLNLMDSLTYHAVNGAAGEISHFIDFSEASNNLYETIIPDNARISRGRPLMILSSDRLDRLAFDALLVSKPENTGTVNYKSLNYLARERTISYAYSLKDLLNGGRQYRKKGAKLKSIFAYAYGDQGSESTRGLPYTQSVLDSLQKIYAGEGTFYLSQGLNLDTFKQALETDVDVIHLGTHALSSSSVRQENKVVLAGENDPAFYGDELLNMSVRADLVVLSACNSSYGAIMPGEGTFSLARSFLISGARHVVSSIWELPDKATSVISTEFHRKWYHGTTVTEALGMAKRYYLDKADAYSSHPGIWAGMRCFVR